MARMEITPRELRDIEIHSEIRGYSRDEVNDLLERAAAAIDASNQRVTQLQERLTSAQSESVRTRETEDILHRTLLLAQRAADEAVAEATAKSRQMIDEAEMSSRRLVADSEAEARRRGETERRRLEKEIVELAGRRDALLADVEALTRFESEHRERMVRALETDLSALRSRPTTAPGSKPETSDVELPASESRASESRASESRASEARASEARPAAAEATAAAKPEPESGPNANSGGDDKLETRNITPESPVGRPGSRPEQAGAATSEVDVRTLFEQSHQQPRESSREQAAKEPKDASDAGSSATARAAGAQPIDLAGSEGVDANLLDDDAFFATLREAVHDESPLGPRDEDDATGENQFFDQDADRGTFRDVFRRRR
ncbi:MAG: cell division initiation protein [Actinomycetota bacterium]|nr:cell division initiation protein [Actinomycetota bacterium]